jgi:hypothetical protein
MPNADLDLLIKTVFDGGRTRVSYTLHSPSGKAGLSYREIAGPTLPRQPQDYQAYLIAKIEKLGEGRDVDGSLLLNEEIERKLTKIGRELHEELFPPEMRQAYREIRRKGVQSIRIVSDEPWIPWELIKPFDNSLPGDILDDDFLCLQFELTRWLSGHSTPAPPSELRVRRLACILTATDLPTTEEEKSFLVDLAQAHSGVKDASPVLSSASAAEAFLQAGGVDLLHFAGHGIFDAANPNESALPFPDGSTLRPSDLQGFLATRIAQDRPFVFLNACSVGQQGWSLTRLGGWADRWVRICGCGAFVAPLWPVRDSLALEFAKAFYTALARGETFGQAGRSAREHVRKLAPGDPSWLAYSIYADAHGRLALGDSELPELPMTRNAVPLPSARMWGVPPVPELFLGRESAMHDFKKVLGVHGRSMRRVAAISGWPGLGKSTFASALARDSEILATFPDGVLWVSLGQEPRLLTKLTRWGEWLGDSSLFRMITLDECLTRLASLLQLRRVLLLLDDVWNQHDAAGFNRLAEMGTCVVVTTRLPAVAAALVEMPESHYHLPNLTEEDGLRLLAALAPDVVRVHPRECRELVRDVEQLPLALHVAGRMLHEENRQGLDVRKLIAEIRSGEGLLDKSAPADTLEQAGMPIPTVSVLLEKSTRLLGEEMRNRFAFLGVMAPKPATFDLEALKTLWQTDDPRPTVRELVGRGLLEPLSSGRFQMHALLVSHALSLLS